MAEFSDRRGTPAGRTDERVSKYAVSPECTDAEFLAASKLYARAVVRERGLNVTVRDLDWEISTRAKRRAGAVVHRDGDPRAIRLTWEHFAENGWAAMAATIRHELVHVHLLNERGDAGHGPAFRRLADEVDAPVHCERFADPEWWVRCTDCDWRAARYRRSKLVASPERFRCGDCGGSLRVERPD